MFDYGQQHPRDDGQRGVWSWIFLGAAAVGLGLLGVLHVISTWARWID